VFWRAVSDLDVPVYFHPRVNIPQISATLYQHVIHAKGPVQEYATTLSTHILGYVVVSIMDEQKYLCADM
jgi:2,3-dihydroxybenzoate decarboxylase